MTFLGTSRRKMLAVISVAGLGLVALPSTSVAEDLLKVKVGDTTSLAQLGMYVGIQKGIFKKHGLDVERISMPGGAKVLTTLLTGDIDVAYLAASTALQAQFQARPVKIVGMSHSMEIYALLGRNDLKGKSASPKTSRTVPSVSLRSAREAGRLPNISPISASWTIRATSRSCRSAT